MHRIISSAALAALFGLSGSVNANLILDLGKDPATGDLTVISYAQGGLALDATAAAPSGASVQSNGRGLGVSKNDSDENTIQNGEQALLSLTTGAQQLLGFTLWVRNGGTLFSPEQFAVSFDGTTFQGTDSSVFTPVSIDGKFQEYSVNTSIGAATDFTFIGKTSSAYRVSEVVFTPIPASALLFGSFLGLMGIMAARRRKASS